MVAWAREISANQTDVPLAENLAGLDQYQTVFFGFPIWITNLPAFMRSFLRSHDLAGKTVIPFITYGRTGIGSSMETVRQFAPEAQFAEPFAIQSDNERTTLESIDAYLQGLQTRL